MGSAKRHEPYGHLSEPTTLEIQRRLPGPIERVWAYLVDGELRRQWLAAGSMEPCVGADFELVWRNDELSDSPAERPAGFSAESRASCRVTEIEPPRRLRFTWSGVGDVTIVLEPVEDEVLLTLTHRGLGDRPLQTLVAAGWHMHLVVLSCRLAGVQPPSFWSNWSALRADYERKLAH